ncbi:hypothetical protein SCATT_41090 [Streptantibioticus cattleyicolor NRRL 8057 = DSM 46488]|uniref:Uncharacterized protein n=1 Tax=Streptantibioticus cattleyicolor (strain ATCC 35852 / DSM 46488 / JCM 4925 / NBRC 14057 / NRRL 8057) TaxID=1003195 RepID=G8WXH0_STREN|nr:hypothetical protein SCATT_41090 [Streptantibioticus cattleyicolor NRRL 8057 = DSM 46488]
MFAMVRAGTVIKGSLCVAARDRACGTCVTAVPSRALASSATRSTT